MAAPDITPQFDPFVARGTIEYVWVEDLVNHNAPTRAELDAGVTLTPIVADQEGWTVKSSQVDANNARDLYTPTVSGEQKADDSSITCYAAKDGADARDLMPDQAEGHIARYLGGDVAGRRVDIFPVQVSAQNPMVFIDGSRPTMIQFQYAIKRKPAMNIPIPVALAAPANLATGTITATSVALTWDAVATATSYAVQVSTDSGATWTDVTAGAGGTPTTASTTVTGLTASTAYQFRVAGVVSGSRGAYSTAVSATTTA